MNCFWVDIVIMTVAKLAQNREKKKKIGIRHQFSNNKDNDEQLKQPFGGGCCKILD